jgi:hypothetical protein
VIREAFENILERRTTRELSMTIAFSAALLIREFFSALIVTLVVLVPEVPEGQATALVPALEARYSRDLNACYGSFML